jgi:AcrR family transcriptional regulator
MGTPAGRQETGSGRAQRADARANRGRILDVAEEVFGRGGESASTEEVARLAGVGIGTVFRHFPTKAALLEAVLVRRCDRLREQAEALLDAADPGEAFFGLFGHLAAHAAAKIAITEALLDAGGDRDGDAARASDGLRRAVGALLWQAQQAGPGGAVLGIIFARGLRLGFWRPGRTGQDLAIARLPRITAIRAAARERRRDRSRGRCSA